MHLAYSFNQRAKHLAESAEKMDALGDFRFLILMIRQFAMEKSLSRDTLMSLSAVNEYYPKIQFLLF